MNFCKKCGAELKPDQGFCASCGAKAEPPSAAVSNSDDLFGKMEISPETATAIQKETKEKEEQRKNQEQAFVQKQNESSDNIFLGFIGALLGALVGAIPWALIGWAGYFAAWAGFLIAIVASKGYDLMKVKLSMKKLWCVIIAVIIGVLAGQIMKDLLILATADELKGYFSEAVTYYLQNPATYFSAIAEELAFGYLFAALGSFTVFRKIKKEIGFLKNYKKEHPEETDL